MENIKKGCRHNLGTVNGLCLTCGIPLKIDFRHYNGGMRKMIKKEESGTGFNKILNNLD